MQPLRSLALLFALGAAFPAGQTVNAEPPADARQVERDIIDRTNAERKKADLGPLEEDAALDAFARAYAAAMAQAKEMSHTVGGDFGVRLKKAGIAFGAAGENVAEGYDDARAVVEGWMNSPGHRANILNKEFTQIGVGVAWDADGTPYYCQEFRKPPSSDGRREKGRASGVSIGPPR